MSDPLQPSSPLTTKPIPPAQQLLPYATAHTPMLSPPFPPPKLTAWVLLTFSVFSTVGGTIGLIWLIQTIAESNQPIGAFACVPVPVVLLLAMMAGLVRETYLAFRRAYRRS